MKKVLGFTMVAMLFMLSACGDNNADAENTVKIGLNYELSGSVASYGQAISNGALLAFEEVNEAGGVIDGKEIEVISYDNKSDPAEVVTMSTKLMVEDKVSLVLGPATSGAYASEVPVSTEYGVPVISCSATSDGCILQSDGTPAPYAYRTCFSDSFQGVAIAQYSYDKLKATKAIVLGDASSDYAKGLSENFISKFESLGGTVVAEESYNAGDTDFNGVITKIKGLDFDVLFVPGYYAEAGLIIKQFRDNGLNQPVLGADGFESPVLIEEAGAEALNDVYYTNHYSTINPSDKMVKFIADYKDKYGEEPNTFAALGYDMGLFAADVINRANSSDPSAINDAIKATTNFDSGVTGAFSIGADHNAIKNIYVIGLVDGEPTTSEFAEVN